MAKSRRRAQRDAPTVAPVQSPELSEHVASRVLLPVVIALAVALIISGVQWPALSAQAISFDDREYLIENPLVQQPGVQSVSRFLGEVLHPSSVRGYYQPLSMISLMLDCALGGHPGDLSAFHRTNLVLHILNTLLVIVLLYLLFERLLPAVLVGLLFGLHPITAESISWVAERKTVLATAFALGSLALYVSYARQGGWKRAAASVLMFALAVMSKPTTIALPVLLVLLDYWPLRRLSRRVLAEKVPYFILAAVSAVVTVISQATTSVTTMPGERSAADIVLVVCHNVVFYLSKICWPAGLTSHYPYPQPLSLSHPAVLAGVVGTAVLVVVLVISLRWTRAFLTGWLLLLVAILPTLGIVGFTDTIAALRFAYFPMLGLLIICASGLCRYWAWTERRTEAHAHKGAAIVLVLALGALEAVATRGYLRHWRDTESLYAHMLSVAPEAPTLHYNLGIIRTREGRPDEAINHFNTVLKVQPAFAEAHCDLATALHQLGQTSDAVAHLQQAVRLKPDLARAHGNLGAIFTQLDKLSEAGNAFRQALQVDSAYAPAHKGLGDILMAQAKTSEAEAAYRRVVELQPRSAAAHYDLGSVLGRQGEYVQAAAQLREAVNISPSFVQAHFALSYVLELGGNVEEAIRGYRRVLELNPNHSAARQALAAANAKSNQSTVP